MPARKQHAVHALRSGSASIRLRAVGEFLQTVGVADEVLLVGASRGAVDDCARAMAMSRGVSFGVHRLSVTQLAARLAMLDLAARDRTPISRLGYEALATRATFDAAKDDALRYLAPVRHTPGFPRALAATLTELRLHGSTPLRSLRARAQRTRPGGPARARRRSARHRSRERSRGLLRGRDRARRRHPGVSERPCRPARRGL